MKKADNMIKSAGATEQDLPGETASIADTTEKRSSETAGATVRIENVASLASQAERPDFSEKISSASATSAPGGSDAHLRALERTHDLVAMNAVRLSESGSDSLRIAIKPGNGLHLSMDLKLDNGSIAAQVALHKGDFGHLSQHWPELQKRLELKGIHLADLTHADQSVAGKGGSHQPKEQPKREERMLAGRSAEFALGGSMTESPARKTSRASNHAGWESWA